MRIRHWLAASLLAASVGCGATTNPNEANFPGAPGSTVPGGKIEDAGKGGGGGGAPRGGSDTLPSTYPGLDQAKKGIAGTGAPKADDAPKTDATKAEAPKTDTPKAEAPKTDAPKTDAPKTDAPKTETKDEAPKK